MTREEKFARFSQSIIDAARPANDETARNNQAAAALVVNSIGSMVQPKPAAVKQTQFDKATNLLGDAIQKARAEKLAVNRETDSKAQKSLAELLTETAAE
jgi:hypothetical protein